MFLSVFGKIEIINLGRKKERAAVVNGKEDTSRD